MEFKNSKVNIDFCGRGGVGSIIRDSNDFVVSNRYSIAFPRL